MTKEVDEAIKRLHDFGAAIERLYDADLLRMATEALTPIYIILKENQGKEQPKPKIDRHLHLVGN